MLFTKVDDPDKQAPPKQDISLSEDYIDYKNDAFGNIPISEDIEVGELASFSDNSFDIGYAADIIDLVSRETSKV